MLLVFGATGQVAQELRKHAPHAAFLGRAAADLSDPQGCAEAIRASGVTAVINAAAYTAVDRAEDEEALATTINGTAPGAMARAAAALGLPFVHISSDYVFDGSGHHAWSPHDPTSPLGAYGRSKLVGEQAVQAAGGRYGILRTSWVFSAHGQNFVKTTLRLSETRDRLQVVEDQIGGPTAAGDIAQAVLVMAEALGQDRDKSGIYHFAGGPDVSWAEFARAIFRLAGRDVEVTGIPAVEYPTPARRPGNSRMNCAETETVFGLHRPNWHDSLAQVMRDLEKAERQ